MNRYIKESMQCRCVDMAIHSFKLHSFAANVASSFKLSSFVANVALSCSYIAIAIYCH